MIRACPKSSPQRAQGNTGANTHLETDVCSDCKKSPAFMWDLVVRNSITVKLSSLPPKKKSPPQVTAVPPPLPAAVDGKGRIFLIDTMSFIFRAYHAMARQRPMSTKTGVPTAATYVFVNMLRKLREDFSPEYLAAVFDVGAPTIRNQQAEAITTIRKFDIKTQTSKNHNMAATKRIAPRCPGTWCSRFRIFGGRWRDIASQFCRWKVTKPTM